MWWSISAVWIRMRFTSWDKFIQEILQIINNIFCPELSAGKLSFVRHPRRDTCRTRPNLQNTTIICYLPILKIAKKNDWLTCGYKCSHIHTWLRYVTLINQVALSNGTLFLIKISKRDLLPYPWGTWSAKERNRLCGCDRPCNLYIFGRKIKRKSVSKNY